MKIIKQGKNEGIGKRSIINTELKDDKGNEIIIDTCYLGGVGSMMDVFFEGKDTTGVIETMVSLNDKWINRTQRRYETEEEAIKDHKKIVELFLKNGVEEILSFNEVCGGGFSETDDELKELMKK